MPRLPFLLPCAAPAVLALGGVLPGQVPAKPAVDPKAALVQRMLQFAGGMDAYRKLDHVAFRARHSRSIFVSKGSYEELWLLSPRAKRARWERPKPKRPVKVSRLGVTYEVMVLDTASKTRKNLVTFPQSPRGSVSLFSMWNEIRRRVFLPFAVVETGAKTELLPARPKDGRMTRRLRVTWPVVRNENRTRNDQRVDVSELVVEVDTGRIVRVETITGRRGEKRSVFELRNWQRVGRLRLPGEFFRTSGKGMGVTLTKVRTGLDLPKDVWSRKSRLIEGLRPLPTAKPKPTSRRK